METNSQIATGRLAASRSQVANRGRRGVNGVGNLGIGHAEGLKLRDSVRPSVHGADATVFRRSLSTAIRNGIPVQCSIMEKSLSTVGDRIRYARNHGPSGKVERKELANVAGIAYSTLADVENGNSASTKVLHRIAKRLKVRAEWLASGKGEMEDDAQDPDSDWSDILGVRQAAALGDGQVADEYAETHKLKFRAESLRRKRLHADKLAVIYGKGDSMHPTIKDGDAILIDTGDKTPRDGHLYVITYDGDLLAKRLMELDGSWYAVSDNEDDPKWRKPRKLDPSKGIEIAGRIRWVAGWVD